MGYSLFMWFVKVHFVYSHRLYAPSTIQEAACSLLWPLLYTVSHSPGFHLPHLLSLLSEGVCDRVLEQEQLWKARFLFSISVYNSWEHIFLEIMLALDLAVPKWAQYRFFLLAIYIRDTYSILAGNKLLTDHNHRCTA